MWIDAHLDLAFNAAQGRDLTLSLDDVRARELGSLDTATVTFEEIRAGGVGLCLGTLFATPQTSNHDGYTTWKEARIQAIGQLDQYRRWQDEGHIRLLASGAEIKHHAEHYDAQISPLGVVLLMEGADPLRDVDDLPFWAAAGVRAIGLSWQRTRFAGGTHQPGPLTERGRELLIGMRELGVVQDISHLDEHAFEEAAELQATCFASHSNSRALVDGNRHLSTEMVTTLGKLGGVIGLVLLNEFLQRGWIRGQPKVELGEVLRHAEYYAELIGWDKVGLGSDLDGGYGNERTPQGIERYRDIGRLAELLPSEVMGRNWLSWLTTHL